MVPLAEDAMTKRDKTKSFLIGRVMAQTGCTFEQAEACYETTFRHAVQTAVTLMSGMLARKALRAVLGRDRISDN